MVKARYYNAMGVLNAYSMLDNFYEHDWGWALWFTFMTLLLAAVFPHDARKS